MMVIVAVTRVVDVVVDPRVWGEAGVSLAAAQPRPCPPPGRTAPTHARTRARPARDVMHAGAAPGRCRKPAWRLNPRAGAGAARHANKPAPAPCAAAAAALAAGPVCWCTDAGVRAAAGGGLAWRAQQGRLDAALKP